MKLGERVGVLLYQEIIEEMSLMKTGDVLLIFFFQPEVLSDMISHKCLFVLEKMYWGRTEDLSRNDFPHWHAFSDEL